MKLKLALFSLIIATLTLSACNKYEEGPFVSFSSPEKRIQGDYIVQSYFINNEVILLSEMDISQYRIVYNDNGTGKTYITSGNYTNESDFEWELDEKKENIRERVLGQNDEWSAWSDFKQILRLTKTEFWIINNSSLEQTEFHLIEQ